MKKTEIKKLSTEQLIEQIRVLSTGRWRAIYAGKPKDGNRMFDLLVVIHRELRERGIEAQRQLLKLLDDPDPGIRCWVAASVLEFAPNEGKRVLTEISNHVDGLIGLSAEWTLDKLKAGTYKPV